MNKHERILGTAQHPHRHQRARAPLPRPSPMCKPAQQQRIATHLGRRIVREVRTNYVLAWPQTVTGVTTFLPRLLLLGAVGHLPNGPVLVGAAGIGSMYSNFAHLMLVRSSTFGATPLFSQAFGAGNHHRVGLVLMRVITIHVFMAILLSLPLTALAAPLLLAFGQPAAIAAHAQTFVWIRFLGVPGMVLFTDVQSFLNAQRCVRLPMVTAIVCALSQCFLVFGLTSKLGFVGAPLAMTLVEILQGVLLLAAAPALLRWQKLRSWPA